MISLIAGAICVVCCIMRADNTPTPAHLPGELSADQVLNGEYPFPPSPARTVRYDETGLSKHRLAPVPPPGVHPRVLISPQELPDLRRRLTETESGRALMATLRTRTGSTILKPGTWENDLYDMLAAGETAEALQLLSEGRPTSYPAGHYQPHILYALTMEAFDAMVSQDEARAGKVAAAVAGWADMIEEPLEKALAAPLNDDVWRIKVSGPATGSWAEQQGLRDLVGGHLLGYAYDFAHNAMSPEQRSTTRRVIARATAGRVWMGARLPHHFRNWNWVAVGLQQPLMALAIEGEEGYDVRAYKMGVEIARDYLTYGISAAGASTEAVGYTQFGLVWGNPFFVAAARRGDNLLTHGNHRAMIDWYLASMEPAGARWQSHGDGGDGAPAIWTLSMWRYFFPDDPKIQLLWQNYVRSTGGKPFEGNFHIIEPLLWCDADLPTDHGVGENLGLPLSWFDPERGSLIVRSGWNPDAAAMQFECRIDSHGPSHEHADRGNFTFSGLGRPWSRESFRSIESRHHSVVLIDGQGQGFWPGPGVWLGHLDGGWAVTAACDARDAYAWWWPKSIVNDPDDSPRFQYDRWKTYAAEAKQRKAQFPDVRWERDDRRAVIDFWQGFETLGGGPRLWDEDDWPVRASHNPVLRAYRTVAFARGPSPYVLIVDDIQKDQQVRLYEWLMQTGPDTELISLKVDQAILGDDSLTRDAGGILRPRKGDRLLLVRVLGRAIADNLQDHQATPSIRLEAFEKVDTNSFDGRSFGVDKRLVVPSRSVSPGFRILLFPHRWGDPLPQTEWDGQRLHIRVGQTADVWTFAESTDGRTRLSGERAGTSVGPIEPQD